jgi:hypothetical protein
MKLKSKEEKMSKTPTVKETNVPTLSSADLDKLMQNSFDNIDSNAVSMPYFKLVSKQSDILEPGSANYVEKAKPGMLFNTATREVYENIKVIPSYFYLADVEWSERGEGSNRPVTIHDISTNVLKNTFKDDKGKDRLENGNYIERTAHHFVVRLDANNNVIDSGLILMSRTQMKKSQRWNTMQLSQFQEVENGERKQLPNHAQIYTLSSTLEKNSKGTWYGWVINFTGVAPMSAINRSVEFRSSVSQNKGVNYADEQSEVKKETTSVTTKGSQGTEATPF